MSKWYEFQFPILNDNISKTFKEVNVFLRNKKIKKDFFFIIKRPNVFLRIKNYKGKDFVRLYEPEFFQFGGSSNWNIISKYLSQLSMDKLAKRWEEKETEIFAKNLLYTIICDNSRAIQLSILKQLEYARPFGNDSIQSSSTPPEILKSVQQLIIRLSRVKNSLFPLDKILPFVLIFCYNIADVPEKIQTRVIYSFKKE